MGQVRCDQGINDREVDKEAVTPRKVDTSDIRISDKVAHTYIYYVHRLYTISYYYIVMWLSNSYESTSII